MVCKGAPEVLRDYFKEIPENYDECSTGLMKDGYRVMALSYRK